VVQARHHHPAFVRTEAVGDERGVEQRHVAGVGHHAGVEQGVLGQLAVGPQPDEAATATRHAGGLDVVVVDVAGVDGAGAVEPVAPLLGSVGEALGEGGHRLGRGCRRHRGLVLEPGLRHLERGGQVEDGPAVLDGHHPPRGERPAVSDAVDLVEDRHRRVAGAQEVGVQRVDGPVGGHRAGGGDEGLTGHLPSEHALAVLVGAHAPEDVHLDRLEVEQLHEGVQGLGHGRSVRVMAAR
jgi:hypothetical protein